MSNQKQVQVEKKHTSLSLPKIATAESEAASHELQMETLKVANEFTAPFKNIAHFRLKLKETENELQALIIVLNNKLSELTELKKQNLQLEHEVLTQIRARL